MAMENATIEVHVITSELGQLARFYTQHQDMLAILAKRGIGIASNDMGAKVTILDKTPERMGTIILKQEFSTFYEAFEFALDYLSKDKS